MINDKLIQSFEDELMIGIRSLMNFHNACRVDSHIKDIDIVLMSGIAQSLMNFVKIWTLIEALYFLHVPRCPFASDSQILFVYDVISLKY